MAVNPSSNPADTHDTAPAPAPANAGKLDPDLAAKAVFTTGEAAEVCKVSQQTIIRCFDAGRLKGFRVPGSRFRRIPRDELLKFMKANDIPTDDFENASVKRVLVVDDDPQIAALFQDLFADDPRFAVRTAGTGYDAGVATTEFKPDLMVLDYMLPDINGDAVCRTVRKNPDLADMKIIVVSGLVNQSEIDGLLQSGADDFVKKPFDVGDLLRRVETMLEL